MVQREVTVDSAASIQDPQNGHGRSRVEVHKCAANQSASFVVRDAIFRTAFAIPRFGACKLHFGRLPVAMNNSVRSHVV